MADSAENKENQTWLWILRIICILWIPLATIIIGISFISAFPWFFVIMENPFRHLGKVIRAIQKDFSWLWVKNKRS